MSIDNSWTTILLAHHYLIVLLERSYTLSPYPIDSYLPQEDGYSIEIAQDRHLWRIFIRGVDTTNGYVIGDVGVLPLHGVDLKDGAWAYDVPLAYLNKKIPSAQFQESSQGFFGSLLAHRLGDSEGPRSFASLRKSIYLLKWHILMDKDSWPSAQYPNWENLLGPSSIVIAENFYLTFISVLMNSVDMETEWAEMQKLLQELAEDSIGRYLSRALNLNKDDTTGPA